MKKAKKDAKLYNLIFPFWMLLIFPVAWLIILPSNFIIDSAVLIISMYVLKMADKKQFYKKHILKIFSFGMLSDVIGAAYMFLMKFVFEIGMMGDEPYLTIPAVLISAAFIFVFNYFISFKSVDKPLRLRLALTFTIVTAPYTFFIPTTWMY